MEATERDRPDAPRTMTSDPPIRVAIIGGGCASIAAAFELTRPRHRGRYQVTVYQLGWRLGGKGASGRGPAGRIEEHGLHLWMGYYENAFRLLRECYDELGRDPAHHRFAAWHQAMVPDPVVALADDTPNAAWRLWTACFPPTDDLPGDPLADPHPFSLRRYLIRCASMLSTLLSSARRGTVDPVGAGRPCGSDAPARSADDSGEVRLGILRILRYGQLLTLASLVEALRVLESALSLLLGTSDSLILRLVDIIGMSTRSVLDTLLEDDDELRRVWAIVDLVLAFLRGAIRFGLAQDPRGLDAIDHFDAREWLRLNGAAPRSLDSTFLRSLYNLGFAYEHGDPRRPRMAAGQFLRGTLRMFFTYRGALFWKMQASMGDVVFAPFYEVLRRRGVEFCFFHRLTDVRLADAADLEPGEKPYVNALEFDIQAELEGDEYRPLIDVRGTSCWPSQPDWRQLAEGRALRREGRDFESHWDRRKVGVRTLRVVDDFDFVVLGVSLGAIPDVAQELIQRDRRWQAMVDQVGTVATQGLQLWMDTDMEGLGWAGGPVNLTGFAEPFDTWADMRQLLPAEAWAAPAPRSIAYFCSALPTPEGIPAVTESDYPMRVRERVQHNAIRFLNHQIVHLWPRSMRRPGEFRWDVLADPDRRPSAGPAGAERIATQFWTANVNPSDRYVLSLPGTGRFRISPLDNTYDNLTIAGDWTDCGFNQGCVEAAVISGRLAAHAIAHAPALEDIVGYDHP